MVFNRTEQLANGEWIEDEEQSTTLKANYVISAFGSGLYEQASEHIHPYTFIYDYCISQFLLYHCLCSY